MAGIPVVIAARNSYLYYGMWMLKLSTAEQNSIPAWVLDRSFGDFLIHPSCCTTTLNPPPYLLPHSNGRRKWGIKNMRRRGWLRPLLSPHTRTHMGAYIAHTWYKATLCELFLLFAVVYGREAQSISGSEATKATTTYTTVTLRKWNSHVEWLLQLVETVILALH